MRVACASALFQTALCRAYVATPPEAKPRTLERRTSRDIALSIANGIRPTWSGVVVEKVVVENVETEDDTMTGSAWQAFRKVYRGGLLNVSSLWHTDVMVNQCYQIYVVQTLDFEAFFLFCSSSQGENENERCLWNETRKTAAVYIAFSIRSLILSLEVSCAGTLPFLSKLRSPTPLASKISTASIFCL